MQYPDTEQIAQNDVARTISFLKDKFDNHSLCNNLETIWHDWSVNMMEPEMTFPVMPVSMTISTILPEKNYCKHVQNELLGKTMDLWVTYTLKLILRSFLLGLSLRGLIYSIIGHLYISLKLMRWIRRGLQRIPILGRIFKNLWELQKLLKLSKHKNYQNNKNY